MAKTDEIWTIGRLLDWTTKFLAQKGSDAPRLDTEVLLSHALGCRRIELYTRFEEEPTPQQRTHFRELVRRRTDGCPVAYLVGSKEFFSLEFEVNPSVLIPRPDTETLVTECLRLARAMPEPRIIDIGTGSGCIAVSIAKRHKTAVVTAVDVSPTALEVARRNAEKHGVADRIRFFEGDLFAPVPEGERFDFVLSNPPYIPAEDLAGLQREVRDHEPHLALDGGPGGFDVFDRLITAARSYLEPGGHLMIEIGAPQEAEARRRLEAASGYDLGKTILDAAGRPRVLHAQRQPVT